MKDALSTAPILKSPDFGKPFLVTCDASGKAVAGVLSQESRPIAYESRKLKDAERNYPAHDLELLRVVHACKVWRHYLLGVRFKIRCDHQSLCYIMTQILLNNRQRRWLEFLQEYDFEIEYLPGRDNVIADALSRRAYASTISVVRGQLGTLVKEALPSDPYFGETYRMLNGVLSEEDSK